MCIYYVHLLCAFIMCIYYVHLLCALVAQDFLTREIAFIASSGNLLSFNDSVSQSCGTELNALW